MQHEYDYVLEGERKTLISTMVLKGKNGTDTAVSKVVGLPMAILLKKVMTGEIKEMGMDVPMQKEIYDPLLKELEDYGIVFKDRHV